MMKYQKGFTLVELVMIPIMLLVVTCIGAWITHVVWVINTTIADGFNSIGHAFLMAFFIPFVPGGVIHGFMLWF